MSTLWGPSRVLGYIHLVEWCLRLDGDLERLCRKLFILVNLDLSDFTRTTLASGQVGLSVTTVCGQDDDILCIQLSLSSSGGERVHGNTQFPGSRSSHGTPGGPIVPPPPGDSDQVMVSKARSPRSESKYKVERPSSCDTGHNARLAMKGSVQQSLVNRPGRL